MDAHVENGINPTKVAKKIEKIILKNKLKPGKNVLAFEAIKRVLVCLPEFEIVPAYNIEYVVPRASPCAR